jgi:hypothetical protein
LKMLVLQVAERVVLLEDLTIPSIAQQEGGPTAVTEGRLSVTVA